LSLAWFSIPNVQPLPRVDASRITCVQVQQRLASDGEIVLAYGAKHEYKRFVSGDDMCKEHLTKSYATSVPTRDNQQCPVRVCDYSR
jgi:hypothetical protein